MKATKHLQHALNALEVQTMQFGSGHHRKKMRYQPYTRSLLLRPKQTYTASTYFPGPDQSPLDAQHAGAPPTGPLLYEVEFEVLFFNPIIQEIFVRVLDIKEFDNLGNRLFSIRNSHIGKTFQLLNWPARGNERVPVPRVTIGKRAKRGSRCPWLPLFHRSTWFVNVPYTALYNAALAKTKVPLTPLTSLAGGPPGTVPRLRDIAKAAIPADQLVRMAAHDHDKYSCLIFQEQKHIPLI